MARLTPFEVGQTKAHAHHGLAARAIAQLAKRSDGVHVSVQGVCDVQAELLRKPSWLGSRAAGSGTSRITAPAEDRAIVREVIRARGRTKVIVDYLKKKFPSLRSLSDALARISTNQKNRAKDVLALRGSRIGW